ncbi:hypothetical protein TNCT_326891 [Trichonephila clavata]|uniref:Uncharacterized protein n=1 Tax=Trichonephila clavata TaxID=2740835 RepID=A0A8X6F2T1_TRICU|nr:hypothetical protein TNCT_326891 [Trichonephila clavata]
MLHWFSIFKVSDKASVTTEIQKYINFYEKMGNIASSSCGEIVKLNEEFDGMLTKAKETKGSTRSSTVYHMCKDFISTEEQVNKVKNVVAQYIDRSEDEKRTQERNRRKSSGIK